MTTKWEEVPNWEFEDTYRCSESQVQVLEDMVVEVVSEGIEFYGSHSDCLVSVRGGYIRLSGWRDANADERAECERLKEHWKAHFRNLDEERLQKARKLLAEHGE